MKAIEALRQNSKTMRSKDFSEYGLGEVYTEPFTVGDREKIQKHVEKKKSQSLFLVYAIIFKAMDEKGEKLFTLEDFESLRNDIPESTTSAIGSFIVFGDDEKN
jgi:hypothetical protein